MDDFSDVVLSWKGQEYRVAPDRIMGLLQVIEAHLCPGGNDNVLNILSDPTRIPVTRLTAATAAALRYAGCKTRQEVSGPDGPELKWTPISDLEVYYKFQHDLTMGDAKEAALLIPNMTQALLQLFLPSAAAADDKQGNGGAAGN